MASMNRVPVFIVGGGPVGLALAVALDRFGIRSLVVERSATTTDHPKSRGCWVRTWMDAARTETTLDWFDQEFVLVTGGVVNAICVPSSTPSPLQRESTS